MTEGTRAPGAGVASPSLPQGAAGAFLKSALRLAGLGCWTWNLSTGEVALSHEAQAIFGEAAPDGTFGSWLRHVDPVDAGRVQQVEDQVRGGKGRFSFEYSFRRPDGAWKRLKSDGEVVAEDEHGMPVLLAGTVLDLGPRDAPRDSALLHLAQAAFTWTWEQDASHRFTALEGARQSPIPELADALGRRRWDLPHAVPLNGSWQEHLATLEAREPIRGFEYRIGEDPQASYVSTSGDPVYDATGVFRGYRGIAHNITGRVRAEEAATHARLLLAQASRLGHLGAWTLRLADMEVEWSHESLRLFGHSGDTPLSWEAALAGLDETHRSDLQHAAADCIARNTSFSLDVRAIGADGTARWLRIVGEPEPTITGPCRRLVGAVQDVSARKEDQRRLQELNEQLVTTFESITEGFYTLDRQWRFTYVNHETERVAQRPRSELLGRSVLDLFPWFRGSRFHREFVRALEDGRSRHFEALLAALDVWAEVSVYPSAQGLAIYFQDITGRKNAQDALRASEERYRLLFQESLDAVIQLEHESGRLVAVNPAACEMFRLTEDQLKAGGRRALIPAGHENRAQAVLAEVDRNGKGGGRLTLLRGDGTEFEAELSGALFKGRDGITYASVFVRDISERLQQEAEILALNEGLAHKVRERTSELEAANAELKAFAHSLAHDLRAPIAAINALGHVLEQRLDTAAERERHYAARIRQAAQQLDEYVEALLSHARISQAPLRASRIDLSGMAERILGDLRMLDPLRAVATHVQPGLTAVGDPALLRMALENLFGNAWKFTKNRADAEIRFSAERQPDGGSTLCISDNGAGFDMEYAHKLFGTFQRLHTHAEFPGTGVGLANVQRIVARHGGRIWAVGKPGSGAAFYFTLPQPVP